MNWADIDWAVLDRLRGRFLSGDPARGPYWTSLEDLAHYDCTYGERIGWKWDAVLQELDRHSWQPPASLVLDWGCGSGVAGRRVVQWLGAERVSALRLWDHSALAAEFACGAARARFSRLAVEQVTPGFLSSHEPVGILVISHVLNELTAAELLALRGLAARAEAILWVEPGTREVSRALIEVREQLRGRFRLVAPCTHQAACGLMTSENARHWCHHFATLPVGIFADSGWVRFGQRAGIDLRSLPYSFLALERLANGLRSVPPTDFSRIIGTPRVYKGFAKVLNCDSVGVTELIVQKRDAPELFKQFKRPAGALVYRWNLSRGKILGGEPLSR